MAGAGELGAAEPSGSVSPLRRGRDRRQHRRRAAFLGECSGAGLHRLAPGLHRRLHLRSAACALADLHARLRLRHRLVRDRGMKIDGTAYRTIWLDPHDGWSVRILDQTKLPWALTTPRLTNLAQAAHAIRAMQVRGAPLIGATAAYGLCLALREDAG